MIKNTIITVITIFACISAEAQFPIPQWGSFGLIVNDTAGLTAHIKPKMVESNNSEYLIIFEDFRAGTSDIYVQKIDVQGKLLFDPQGISIANGEGEQSNCNVISDGAGGAIVVWQDSRRGDFDIYAQRIDLNGKSLWAQEGLPICEMPEGQVFPEVASDGLGGAIITWYDYRSGSEDIYAQRIDAQGRILWTTGGVPVCQAEGTQWFPKIVSDSANGAIISWMDRRSGNFDIYAQKVDYTGKLIWQQNGVPVCQANGNQENVDMVQNEEGGAIIIWKDSRPEAPGLYVQKIDKDGKPALNYNGILVSQNSDQASPPKIAPDGKGGTMIVWSDPRAGDPDIYMQFLSKDGKLLWGDYGSPIVRIKGAQENPEVSGNSPFVVIWSDKRSGSVQLYAQAITEAGGYLFANPEGVLISSGGVEPQNADAILRSNGDIMCSYQDRKKGNFDIYASYILSGGKVHWLNMVNNTKGAVPHQNFDCIYTEGGVVFAFEDFRNGYSNIYLQKVSKTGGLLWGKNGVAAAAGKYNQKNPSVISDGGGAIVVFEDFRWGTNARIYAQKITSDGSVAWEDEGIPVAPKAPSIEQTKPKIAPDGDGGAVIVYCDYRSNLNYQDIYAQRIKGDGGLLWGNQGKVVSAGDGDQDDPVIAPKSLYITWTDYRNGESNADIYAQKLDLSGNRFLAEDGIPVCEAPDSQRDPFILDDGAGGVIIAWTDRGGGSFDIFTQRLDSYGKPLFIKDGIPVCQSARTQQGSVIVPMAAQEFMFFFEDFRFGNWDIFSQKLNNQGKLVFPEEGLPIVNLADTQYSPFAAAFQDGAVVAWEDYRNGKNYNVYMQKVSNDGTLLWGENGFLVPGTSLGARYPKLVALPDKSLILGWEDYRYGRRAIYAQKFTF